MRSSERFALRTLSGVDFLGGEEALTHLSEPPRVVENASENLNPLGETFRSISVVVKWKQVELVSVSRSELLRPQTEVK